MVHSDFLRFKNGGGQIFDDSEVCEKSFLDRASVVKNQSSIWNSEIRNSQISRSTVTGAKILDSWIEATCVTGGTVENESAVKCELVTGNAVIKKSLVTGASRIAHDAHLENVKFKNLTVKGSARVLNWTEINADGIFNGLMGYITRGDWERPPRVIRLPFEVTLTESIPGYAFVACYEFPLERWLKIGNRYGRARGWSPDQIQMVRDVFTEWDDQKIPIN